MSAYGGGVMARRLRKGSARQRGLLGCALRLWLSLVMLFSPGSGGGELLGGGLRWVGPPLARAIAGAAAALVASAPVARFALAQSAPAPETWGLNANGQLGNNSTTNSATPVSVSNLGAVTQLSGGWGHSLALKPDGTVTSWGKNIDGQLGNNTMTESHVPVSVSSLTGVVAIAAGKNHSLALKNDGSVWAWGSNRDGQLGTTSSTTCTDFDQVQISCSLIPIQIPSFTGVIAIAAGWDHSLAVKSDGSVWAWGANSFGGLGDGTHTSRSSPVQVLGPGGSGTLSRVQAVSAGQYHSLALKTDGTVWAWGGDVSGQLGNNSTTSTTAPVQVVGVGGSGTLGGIIAIAAGQYHSLALQTQGTIVAWGKNDNGQLGATSSSSCGSGYACSLVPLSISNFFRNSAIAAGGGHSMALKGDGGTVFGWGENDDGELGDGTTTNRSTPVQTSSLANMTTIGAGVDFSLAASTAPVLQTPPAAPSTIRPTSTRA